MPNIKVTRPEFEAYWVNRHRRQRRLNTLQNLLFGHGENGFLFGNFAELDELFTTSVGPTAVAANDDPVGLALDDSAWGGRTLAQVIAAATEMRGTGAVGLLGSATAATYNPSTGAGSVTRVDGVNQSYVTFAVTNGKTYAVNITATNAVLIRNTPTGTTLYGPTAGSTTTTFIVGASSAIVITFSGASGTANFTVNSIKEVPGNHALQATAANRPLWKANAGKPYLLFDGSNDVLVSAFRPMNGVSSLTMASAFRSTQGAVQATAMGGGSSVGPGRAYIALLGNGVLSIGWGSQISRGGAAVDLRNQNHVVVVTGEANNRDIWLDGVNVTAEFATAVGGPVSTGAIAIGGRNNESAVVDQNMSGNFPAALALDRRVTPAEIARITADFQSTF